KDSARKLNQTKKWKFLYDGLSAHRADCRMSLSVASGFCNPDAASKVRDYKIPNQPPNKK
ncbi:MAG: hypothetical protein KAR36_09525, partial [Candidatus Latescibacteria bacterium]|nr:hypothetical protein [Candidatus Latescibacterota bacterium]